MNAEAPDVIVVLEVQAVGPAEALAEGVSMASGDKEQSWLFDNWPEASAVIQRHLTNQPDGAVMISAKQMDREAFNALPEDPDLPAVVPEEALWPAVCVCSGCGWMKIFHTEAERNTASFQHMRTCAYHPMRRLEEELAALKNGHTAMEAQLTSARGELEGAHATLNLKATTRGSAYRLSTRIEHLVAERDHWRDLLGKASHADIEWRMQLRERQHAVQVEAQRIAKGLDAHLSQCLLTKTLGDDTNCLSCQAKVLLERIANPATDHTYIPSFQSRVTVATDSLVQTGLAKPSERGLVDAIITSAILGTTPESTTIGRSHVLVDVEGVGTYCRDCGAVAAETLSRRCPGPSTGTGILDAAQRLGKTMTGSHLGQQVMSGQALTELASAILAVRDQICDSYAVGHVTGEGVGLCRYCGHGEHGHQVRRLALWVQALAQHRQHVKDLQQCPNCSLLEGLLQAYEHTPGMPEPPIVRGALDAQEAAERKLAAANDRIKELEGARAQDLVRIHELEGARAQDQQRMFHLEAVLAGRHPGIHLVTGPEGWSTWHCGKGHQWKDAQPIPCPTCVKERELEEARVTADTEAQQLREQMAAHLVQCPQAIAAAMDAAAGRTAVRETVEAIGEAAAARVHEGLGLSENLVVIPPTRTEE